MGGAGARCSARALGATCLNTLRLTRNQIGDGGASALARALRGSAVTSLCLGNNQIGNVGAQELATAVMVGEFAVKELNLENNYIRAAGKQALAVLRESAAVTDFGLRDDWQMPARG